MTSADPDFEARVRRSFDKQRVMHILKNLGCTASTDIGNKGAAYHVPDSLLKVSVMAPVEKPFANVPSWVSPKPSIPQGNN